MERSVPSWKVAPSLLGLTMEPFSLTGQGTQEELDGFEVLDRQLNYSKASRRKGRGWLTVLSHAVSVLAVGFLIVACARAFLQARNGHVNRYLAAKNVGDGQSEGAACVGGEENPFLEKQGSTDVPGAAEGAAGTSEDFSNSSQGGESPQPTMDPPPANPSLDEGDPEGIYKVPPALGAAVYEVPPRPVSQHWEQRTHLLTSGNPLFQWEFRTPTFQLTPPRGAEGPSVDASENHSDASGTVYAEIREDDTSDSESSYVELTPGRPPFPVAPQARATPDTSSWRRCLRSKVVILLVGVALGVVLYYLYERVLSDLIGGNQNNSTSLNANGTASHSSASFSPMPSSTAAHSSETSLSSGTSTTSSMSLSTGSSSTGTTSLSTEGISPNGTSDSSMTLSPSAAPTSSSSFSDTSAVSLSPGTTGSSLTSSVNSTASPSMNVTGTEGTAGAFSTNSSGGNFSSPTTNGTTS